MTRIEIDEGCYVDIFIDEERRFCIAFDARDDEESSRWAMAFSKEQLAALIKPAIEYLGLADDHK